MSGELTAMAAEASPYVTAAASAYGGAVLAKVRDDAADATAGLGRRLLQRVFGTRHQGEPLPEPLASLTVNPTDPDAAAAVRRAIRTALEADAGLQADVAAMLAPRGVTVTARGERAIAAQTITGSIAVTGDNADIAP